MQDVRKTGLTAYQLLLCAGAGVTILGFGPVRAELDPWAGTYEVVRVEPGRGEWSESDLAGSMFQPTGWLRWYTTIETDRRISSGWTWVCGQEGTDSISGDAKRVGTSIHVMERPFLQQAVSPYPLLVLDTRGHEVIREVPVEGGSVKLVFARTENASTLLDYVGFR